MKKFKKVKITAPNKATVRRFAAKPVAFTALVVLSSYGCRTLLKSLTQGVSLLITSLIVFMLCYTLFED